MKTMLTALLAVAGCAGVPLDDPCPQLSYQDEADLIVLIQADYDLGFSKQEELSVVPQICQRGDSDCFVCVTSAINYVYGG